MTPFRMSGSSREALPDVREWSGGPPGGPGVVVRPFRRSGSGREALLNDREWVGMPSQMSGSGREALPDA